MEHRFIASIRSAALGVGAACLLAAPAAADVLLLKDGRILDGVALSRADEVVTVHYENGDVAVPEKLIRECVLEKADEAYEPKDEKERKMLDKGYVRFDDKWMSRSRRDKLVQKRLDEHRERIEDMKATREWRNRYTEESEFFVFEANIPRHVFEYFRDLMDTYTREFFKMWKIKKPRDLPKLKVKFFNNYEDFIQITGMSPGVLGFFVIVPPFELNMFYDRLDPRYTEEVMYHEAGHYLQRLVDVDFSYPHWPGESIGEYFAASEWDNEEKTLTFDLLHEGRLAAIQQDIANDKWQGLRDMLVGCNDRNFNDYSWGWSFVHFLMSKPATKKNFQKFIVALARGRDIDRINTSVGRHPLKTVEGDEMLAAFMKYMKIKSEEDLSKWETDWHQYIENDLEISSIRGYEMAAKRAEMSGRTVRATSLYNKAVMAGTDKAVTYHYYARLLEADDDYDNAYKMWSRAVELDPLTPDFYIAWGETLIRKGDDEQKEEGKRLLRLAHEIEPDNYYLERNMKRLLAK